MQSFLAYAWHFKQGLLRDERSAKVFNTVMALALTASVLMIFWQENLRNGS